MARSTRTAASIANVVGETVARAHEATEAGRAASQRKRLTVTLEDAEKHLKPAVTRMLSDLADIEDKPEWLQVLMESGTAPEAQWDIILQLLSLLSVAVTGIFALGQPALTQLVQDLKHDARTLVLSPPDLATAVVRGKVGADWASDQAGFSQLGQNNFDILVEISGEPPGPLQLAEAYRRGYIDEARFTTGIKESRIKDEWIDTMLALRFAPPSPADAIRAAIRTRLTVDEARAKAELGGMAGTDFDWVLNATGNPPSLTELFNLYHRGHIALADVDQGIREGNVMNKYVTTLDQLRTPIPGLLYIRLLVAANAVSDAQAVAWIQELGYSDAIATGIVSASHKTKTAGAHNIAESQVLKLYQESAIADTEARQLLANLGYDAHETDLLMSLADHAEEMKQRDAVIAHVKARFIAWHIDETTATAELGALGIASAMTNDLMRYWQMERDTTTRQLTPAQLLKANKTSVIDDLTTEARLMELGYTKADADLLIVIDGSGGASLT